MARSLAGRMLASPIEGVPRVGGVTGVEEPNQRASATGKGRVTEIDVRPDPRAHLKQQPALFDQRQIKPKPEIRYPRGYTPGRMKDVRQATAGLVTIPGIRTNQQQFGVGPSMGTSVDHPFYHPHGERMIQEAVARSTMPTEHLEGIKGVQLMPQRKLGHESMAGTWGLYTPGSRMVRMFPTPAASPKRGPDAGKRMIEPIGRGVTPQEIRRAQIGVAPPKYPKEMYEEKGSRGQRQAAEMTLIHELGHHVSIQSTQGWSGKGTMMHNPLEEARADRYMMWHWRPHPADVRAGEQQDVEQHTYIERMKGYGPYTMEDLKLVGRPPQRPPGAFGTKELPQMPSDVPQAESKGMRGFRGRMSPIRRDNINQQQFDV
jgi:hypothetical protein